MRGVSEVEGGVREEELKGRFLGVLPSQREFEFQVEDSGKIIDGEVGATITDAGIINDHLRRSVTIRVRVKRMGINNPPTYVLLGYVVESGGGDA